MEKSRTLKKKFLLFTGIQNPKRKNRIQFWLIDHQENTRLVNEVTMLTKVQPIKSPLEISSNLGKTTSNILFFVFTRAIFVSSETISSKNKQFFNQTVPFYFSLTVMMTTRTMTSYLRISPDCDSKVKRRPKRYRIHF